MDEIPGRHRKKQRKPNDNKDAETEAPPVETSKQFSKRELSSNWTKYEDNTPSNDVPNAPNFEELLMAPASIGGHFLFNSEKSWEANDDWYNRDEYFQLNLVELSKSLATIPFYERQNYGKDIFSSLEIEDMDRQAKYQFFKRSANSKNTVKLSKADGVVDVQLNETKSAVNLPQNDDDDLDELLNLTGAKQQTIQSSEFPSVERVTIQFDSASTALDSTDDIQKWLDDVLVLDS